MRHANVALFVPNLGCPHDCSFCNQREISGQAGVPSPADVQAAASQALKQLGEKARFSEIAFFGGSFTAIDRKLMIALLEAAFPFVGTGGYKGIRLSTRPDSVDPEVLDILHRYGVTSIELGAQSMDDRVLTLNNRGHGADDVRKASALIKKSGFELGLQMMTGLYGDTPQGAWDTARVLAGLQPKTVRIYPTVVLTGTRLAQLYREGLYRPQELEEAVTLCAGLLRFFTGQHIPVIRLGLHASEGIENSYVAGPWHPAFRELCEGRIYLEQARKILRETRDRTSVCLLVGKSEISKMAGQHKMNRTALEEEFHIKIRIMGSDGIDPFTVKAVNYPLS